VRVDFFPIPHLYRLYLECLSLNSPALIVAERILIGFVALANRMPRALDLLYCNFFLVQHQQNPGVNSRASPLIPIAVQRDVPIVQTEMGVTGQQPVDTQGVNIHLATVYRPAGQVGIGVAKFEFNCTPPALIDRPGHWQTKTIRVSGLDVSNIPAEYWKKPSWE
jgi:hypothetical protein